MRLSRLVSLMLTAGCPTVGGQAVLEGVDKASDYIVDDIKKMRPVFRHPVDGDFYIFSDIDHKSIAF